MSKTLFSRIIEGEIPSYKVYENPYVFAFLDIHPANHGHVLIVPKIEIDHFTELPEPFYSEVFKAAKLISQAQKQAFNVSRISLQIHGFDVPHVHVHCIPANTMQDARIQQVPMAESDILLENQKKILAALV